MSQATQAVPLKHQLSAHRVLAVSALLALLATAAVVLVLTIGGGSTQTSAPAGQSTHPRVLWNGRPAESGAAASRTSAGPDESSIAATIGSGTAPSATGDTSQTRKWAEYEAKISSMTPAELAAAFGSAREAAPKVGEIKVSPSIRH
jgi:hypothetical protein